MTSVAETNAYVDQSWMDGWMEGRGGHFVQRHLIT